MNRLLYLVAGAALGMTALAGVAKAQDMTTATFGGTTIWVGGGVQFLSLPDVKFVGVGTSAASFQRQKNSDFGEYGWASGGGIETAFGYWGGSRVTGSLKGFFTGVEDGDRQSCRTSACVLTDPAGTEIISGPPKLITKTDRDVDYWGGQAELKFGGGQPVHERPNLYRNDYFIIGADVRGIDQDIDLRGHWNGQPIFTLSETIDTTYVGGYIGLGGEYSLGFLRGANSIGERLGLRTFINARAGLYNASTDYDGTYAHGALNTDQGHVGALNTKTSLSNDELAFIGSVSFETRKQLGPRSSVSLWTDYEFISSVPEMKYASGGSPTRIDDDFAWGSRTMLRLNIGLGSAALYPEQY